MDLLANRKLVQEWFNEITEELSTTREILLRVASLLGVDTQQGEWPAHRIAMRIEQAILRQGAKG